MTSAPWPSGADGLSATVVAPDVIVRGSLVRALHECRVDVVERTIKQLARADEKSGVVCTDSSLAGAVLGLNVPTVIVTRGMSVSDEVWAELLRQRPVLLDQAALTPLTLLQALLRARFGTGPGDAPSSLSCVPPDLLRAFLAGPRAVKRIGELARTAGYSLEALRGLDKDLGCSRFESLTTKLRAAVWRWLVSAGVDRTVVEAYLGIVDRSNFRRACRRAQVAVPWSGG